MDMQMKEHGGEKMCLTASEKGKQPTRRSTFEVSDEEDGSGSFQTWGEKRNMRFAAVPFCHEIEDLEDDEEKLPFPDWTR